MAQNEIDLVDVAPLAALPIFAGMVFGVWNLELSVFGGYNFTEPLWSGHGIEISMAMLLTVGSIVAIVATNEIDGSSYEDYELAAIVAALAAAPLYEFVPAVQSVVDSNDAIAGIIWLAVAVVATGLAYTE